MALQPPHTCTGNSQLPACWLHWHSGWGSGQLCSTPPAGLRSLSLSSSQLSHLGKSSTQHWGRHPALLGTGQHPHCYNNSMNLMGNRHCMEVKSHWAASPTQNSYLLCLMLSCTGIDTKVRNINICDINILININMWLCTCEQSQTWNVKLLILLLCYHTSEQYTICATHTRTHTHTHGAKHFLIQTTIQK